MDVSHRGNLSLSELSPFQVEVAKVFFSLPASQGFLLAGGGALLAAGLSSRPTRDLDFFGVRGKASVEDVTSDFVRAIQERGWQCAVVDSGPAFRRIEVVGSESLVIDIAHDSPPFTTPMNSVAGPIFAPLELATRKLIALFDRAEARDFVDVYFLARQFDKVVLLAHAQQIDAGLASEHLCDALLLVDRYKDRDLPIDKHEVAELREFFRRWATDLARAN